MVAHGICFDFYYRPKPSQIGQNGSAAAATLASLPYPDACSNFNALVQHIDPSSVPKPTPDSELFLYQRKSVFKNKPSAYYVGATFLFSALVRGKHLLFTRTTLVH